MIQIPKPWQKIITNFVVDHPRCNIWADMGSGKTSGVLTALDILLLVDAEEFFPALVISPLRVARDVWPFEVEKWDNLNHLRMEPILGSVEDRRRAIERQADIYTINYENIPWLVEHLQGRPWPFKTVVADESTRLKGHRLNKGGMRAKKLAEVARKTKRWINLTGTPSPNGLKDLWGQNWFLDFGERLLGTYTDFKNTWFYPDFNGELIPQKFADAQIAERLKDITLTVDLRDWIDLKKPVNVVHEVSMPPARLKEYRELEREMFVTLENSINLTAMSAAAKSTKCLQFAAGAVYYEDEKWTVVHDAKLDALEEIFEETAGANILIAYWWRHDAARILKRFPDARLLKTKKDEDDWNAGKISKALIHPKSGGHGLNLQHGGHHIVHYSLWWDLEAYQQVIDRIGPARQHQSGYDRAVYVHHMIMNKTLDVDVYDRLQSKKSVQEVLKAAMKRSLE